VAAYERAAWVADLAGAVIWIDAESNAADEPISVGGSPQSLVFGDGALWVADAFNRTVTRIGL
jgi:DNA-binding beta-propeller fold protein YncE